MLTYVDCLLYIEWLHARVDYSWFVYRFIEGTGVYLPIHALITNK